MVDWVDLGPLFGQDYTRSKVACTVIGPLHRMFSGERLVSTMKIRLFHLLLITLFLAGLGLGFRHYLPWPFMEVMHLLQKNQTIADRVVEFEKVVYDRLLPAFDAVDVSYPPAKVTFVGIKATRLLEVWVAGPDDHWKHLKDYPILGMSGRLGPKLKEGDRQVPEGLYRVESLNPNSRYHLSLRVDYPNEQDKSYGRLDGRDNLGTDIMIHGKDCSIGCLAMGDPAAEDLFILAEQTGIENISILLTPVDFRKTELPANMPPVPAWTGEVYEALRRELNHLT